MIQTELATEIVRAHVAPQLCVVDIRPLTGGMINTVVEWITDGEPPSIVAKINEDPSSGGFAWEYDALRYFREHTSFPVPEPYACLRECGDFRGHCLLMEKIPGRHLGCARLSHRGMRHFQRDMARRVADLHDHRRSTYGAAADETTQTVWLDSFAEDIADEFHAVADQLTPGARRTVTHLLDHLGDWLPEFHQPTLVHGDLWATNIMVDDSDPDAPAVGAFLDGGANFCEVEHELAYLRVFKTADETFFEHYARRHPIRDGFDRRCRVYWLNTMMLHVRHFGVEYLPPCEGLAEEIARLE
jgi:fructosamine-3-kinase